MPYSKLPGVRPYSNCRTCKWLADERAVPMRGPGWSWLLLLRQVCRALGVKLGARRCLALLAPANLQQPFTVHCAVMRGAQGLVPGRSGCAVELVPATKQAAAIIRRRTWADVAINKLIKSIGYVLVSRVVLSLWSRQPCRVLRMPHECVAPHRCDNPHFLDNVRCRVL